LTCRFRLGYLATLVAVACSAVESKAVEAEGEEEETVVESRASVVASKEEELRAAEETATAAAATVEERGEARAEVWAEATETAAGARVDR
jgi:hypothetical protein